jgi:predicted secreted protein
MRPLVVKSPHRWIALGLALAGACAFAVSVWVGTWWTIGEATIGPFGSRACFDGDCRLRGLSWMGASDTWMRSAIATGVAGVVAMFVLTALAGAAAARRTPRLVARTALVAIATALVCGIYFVATFPGVGGAKAHLELGAPLFAVGAVLGIASAIVVIRHK